MARYISSVVVVLFPKTVKKSKELGPVKSFVVSLDYNSGATVSHAVEFVSKCPLVKGLLPNYYITNFTFEYFEL